MTAPRFLPFEDAARLAGHCRWFEMRLFEVVGGWAEAENDPAARLLLRTHSFRHAWHAELWEESLPVSGPLDGATLTVPASEEVAAVLDALVATPRSESGVERLTGLYRVVLPGLVQSYGAHLERAGSVAEGPARRVLRLVVTDEEAECREGKELLKDMVEGSAGAGAAASEQDRLEGLVAVAGAIPSPVGIDTSANEVE